MLQVKNNSSGSLVAAISSSDVSLTLNTGEGANFPSVFPFHITIDSEILDVTNRVNDKLTVARGVEGTLASSHVISSIVELKITAGVTQEIQTGIEAIPTQTETLKNKRIEPRAYTTSSTTKLNPEIDTYDLYRILLQSTPITIANPTTSSPTNGEQIRISILDNGISQTISFGSDYGSSANVILPTSTKINTVLEMGFEYNSSLAKWILLAKN